MLYKRSKSCFRKGSFYKNFTESKSEHFAQDEADSRSGSSNYSRAVSVPGSSQSHRPTQLGLDETDDARLKMYSNGRGFAFSSIESEQIHPGMKQTRAVQVGCVLLFFLFVLNHNEFKIQMEFSYIL